MQRYKKTRSFIPACHGRHSWTFAASHCSPLSSFSHFFFQYSSMHVSLFHRHLADKHLRDEFEFLNSRTFQNLVRDFETFSLQDKIRARFKREREGRNGEGKLMFFYQMDRIIQFRKRLLSLVNLSQSIFNNCTLSPALLQIWRAIIVIETIIKPTGVSWARANHFVTRLPDNQCLVLLCIAYHTPLT